MSLNELNMSEGVQQQTTKTWTSNSIFIFLAVVTFTLLCITIKNERSMLELRKQKKSCSHSLSPLVGNTLPPRTSQAVPITIRPACMVQWAKMSLADVETNMRKSGLLKLKFQVKSSSVVNDSLQAVPMSIHPEILIKKSISRFPHFAEAYFNYFSLILWSHDFHLVVESRVNSTIRRHRVAFENMILEEDKRENFPDWTIDLVKAVDKDLHMNSIISASCNHVVHNMESKGWFLHPSDAFLLGSFIAQEDICKYQGIAHEILGDNYNVKLGILDRRMDRRVLNAQQLMSTEFVTNHVINGTSKFKKFYLDGKRLLQQAKLIREVDILLTVKGAGETNIAWMKPCSIVLEVSPWGYYVPHYFQKLARRSGLLHYPWQVDFKDTGLKNLYRNRPECAVKFASVNRQGLKNKTIVNKECFGDDLCRSCTQNVDGVWVDIKFLKEIILKMSIERRACIESHPFLGVEKQISLQSKYD